MNGAADEKSPGTSISPSESRSAGSSDTERGRRTHRGARRLRASARCGRASAPARAPSSSPRRPGRRAGRPTSPARSRPAARTRSRAAAGPRSPRQRPAAGSTAAPICAGAARRSGPSAASTATRRRSARTRPSWPGEDARQGAGRACPRCRSRSAPSGARRPRRPDAVDHAASSSSRSSTCDAERAHGAERRLGVGRAAPVPRRRSRPRRARRRAARGARSTCRREPRRRPTSIPAGSILTPSTGTMSTRVALALEQRRGPRRLGLALDEHGERPPRSGETWWSSKSSMLIRSTPSAWVIPASTPGRSGTWTSTRCSAPGSGNAPWSRPRLLTPPRRSSARGSPRRAPRARPRPARSGGGARRARRRARRRCRGRCRPRSAGSRRRCASCRGASRPPLASGSWPSTRRGAGLVQRAGSRARAAGGS